MNTTQPPMGETPPSAALPLVLIHGSGDTAALWRPLIERLGGDPSVVALDLPGHGTLAGQPWATAPSVADYAEAVRAECARRELAAVCLGGHSLGSAIALRLAADQPALVRRLVLIGAGARLRVLPALLAATRDAPADAQRRMSALSVARGHEGAAAWLAAHRGPIAPDALYRDLAACDAFDMMAELGRISQPALLITGATDAMTPPKYAAYLRDHLPDARLVIVPGAGHYVLIEDPAAVADAIHAWLAET